MLGSEEIEFPIIILSGTILFGILSLTIILFFVFYQRTIANQHREYQRALLKTTIQAQEKERQRFSEDLHDDLGSNLSVLKLKLDFLEQSKTSENFSEVKLLVARALSDTRKVARSLSPVILERYGLEKALEDLSARTSVKDKLMIEFKGSGINKVNNKITELALFRITQEILSNSIKHGNATEIEINLNNADETIILTFTDNGIFFNITEIIKNGEGSGLGLKNINSRLIAINGEIKYKRNEDNKNQIQVLKFIK